VTVLPSWHPLVEVTHVDDHPRYFWFYGCEQHCSFWRESTDIKGDVRWSEETCPYDGTRISEVKGEVAA